ncbi:hypothetical protein KKB44_03375 [Candidatus Micrarchaeota archaeon]|nr:hypothetical protein [Candidatus Micrarchaeota archaeon]
MHTRLVLLALLFIFSAAFAVEPIEDLIYAVPIVALIVIVFLALSNMLAASIGDPRLQAWAKNELREFFAAVILIAIIAGAFIGSTGVSEAITGESDYVQVSLDMIDSWINNYDEAFSDVIRAATRIRSAATYSPYINIPLWYVSISYSGNPIGGVSLMLISLNLAAQALTNITFIYEGIRMLVVFLKITIPEIFLPLAFIVRMIPFTRKLGNTLIALSLAGIVFLPLSIIMADALNQSIDFPTPRISNLDNLDADPWAMVAMEWLCESEFLRIMFSLTDPLFAIIVCFVFLLIPVVGAGLFNACKPIIEYIVYPIIQLVFQLVFAFLLLIWSIVFAATSDDYADKVFDTLYPFLRDVNNAVLMGYLDFILIAVVTIAGAKSLSTALGGEWYMAGIQRLI